MRRFFVRSTVPALIGLNLSLMLSLMIFWAPAASAQDLFALFGHGTEAKAHAGAGIVSSRGPAANYYNPANLALSRSFDPYFEMDIVRFEYTYTYPGYEPIKIRRWTPLPFFGLSHRPLGKDSSLVLGYSLLPLGGAGSEQEIDGLPTRQLALEPDSETEPVIVDVEQKGKGFSYRLSIGASWTFMEGFSAGLSITHAKSGTETKVKDDLTGTTASVLESETSSYQIILGTRGSAFDGMLRAMTQIKLPSSQTTRGETSVPVFGPEAKVDTGGSSKGPLGFGLGLEGKFPGLGRRHHVYPFFEYSVEQWSALAGEKTFVGVEEVAIDYFDASAIKLGMDYEVTRQHRASVALGQYQSPLGDGIQAKDADDGEELAGMQFQNLDRIPHARFALGYRMAFEWGHLQSGLSYHTGTREVWDKARGYGTYELKIYTLLAGGVCRF